jgi:hypothetical protein
MESRWGSGAWRWGLSCELDGDVSGDAASPGLEEPEAKWATCGAGANDLSRVLA